MYINRLKILYIVDKIDFKKKFHPILCPCMLHNLYTTLLCTSFKEGPETLASLTTKTANLCVCVSDGTLVGSTRKKMTRLGEKKDAYAKLTSIY